MTSTFKKSLNNLSLLTLMLRIIVLIGVSISSNAYSLSSEEANTAAAIQQAIDKQRQNDINRIEDAKDELNRQERQAEKNRNDDAESANLSSGGVPPVALIIAIIMTGALGFGLAFFIGNYIPSWSNGFNVGFYVGGLVIPIFSIFSVFLRGYAADYALAITTTITFFVLRKYLISLDSENYVSSNYISSPVASMSQNPSILSDSDIREIARENVAAKIKKEYQDEVDIFNSGIENLHAYIHKKIFNLNPNKHLAYKEIIRGYQQGSFFSSILSYEFENKFKDKLIDKDRSEKYLIEYLKEIIIPIYSRNKDEAFAILQDGYLNPDWGVLKTNNEFTEFYSEYDFYIFSNYAKKQFENKKAHVKKYTVNKNLAVHLYCLAQIYATGKCAAFTEGVLYLPIEGDKYKNSTKTVETYNVCEKDEKYALELLKKAMEVARENMKGMAQVELLEKCNKLNEKLGVTS